MSRINVNINENSLSENVLFFRSTFTKENNKPLSCFSERVDDEMKRGRRSLQEKSEEKSIINRTAEDECMSRGDEEEDEEEEEAC